tara:strand:- start:337 stop:849 length:513 start_codon:yes stop_codon:yes gene_type:complete
MQATIQIDGNPVELQFHDCVLFTSGEFGGNIDFQIAFSEPVPDQEVIENLRLRMPGKKKLLDVTSFGDLDGVMEITIFSESELAPIGQAIADNAVPSEVEVFWLATNANNPLLTMNVTPEAGDPDDIQPGDYKLSDYRLASESGRGSGCGTAVLAILGVIITLAFTLGAR